MFADEGACGGEGIVLTDKRYGIRVPFLSHQRNITWNIHPRRTECHAGHRLGDGIRAFSVLNMIDKVISAALESCQHHMGGFKADGAVCGIRNVVGGFFDKRQGVHGCGAVQNLFQQILKLSQAYTAGYTLTAGLRMAQLEK